jgi:ribosome-associated toxin RatA of RatAB toxin-antitoxin module
MVDHATDSILIAASADRCWNVVLDFAAYPQWARDIKQVSVVATDEQGRATEVSFRAAAMGRSARYTLRYDYSAAPEALAWELVESDIMRSLSGEYRFVELAGGTQVTYELEVELVLPLPGFVKRRAEHKIIGFALDSLRRRVESLEQP